eukprot:TRINITY_DN19149_c0_g2_i1.p1 TRINITY_DN19149_c0_g2~~TRINITY_DN19149_c0_g2_i1.p1  ORF type:complete len:704 (+),score=208.90 TRINITY_DN19149_c0_g2_i1:60-2114(+)
MADICRPEQKEKTPEEARSLLGDALVNSMNDGSLEAALAATLKPADGLAGQSLEEKKAQLRNVLEASLHDGSLEAALASTAKEQDSMSLDCIREKIATQLEAALGDGSLEQVLKGTTKQQTDGETNIDELRTKMAQCLEASLTDGSLEKALAESLKATPSLPSPDEIEKIRLQMVDQLEVAFEKGVLHKVFEEISKEAEEEQQAASMDEIRAKMANQLEAALQDGRLETVLASACASTKEPSSPPPSRPKSVEEIRHCMAQQLEAALDDGSLEKALSSKTTAGTDKSIEDIRTQMADKFKEALDTGFLEEALSKAKAQSEPRARPKTPDELEALRMRMATQLEASLNNGALETVLAEIEKDRTPPSTAPAQEKVGLGKTKLELDELRREVAQQLEVSATDGSLEKALAEVKQQAKQKEPEDQVPQLPPRPMSAGEVMKEKLRSNLEESFRSGQLKEVLASKAAVEETPIQPKDLSTDFAAAEVSAPRTPQAPLKPKAPSAPPSGPRAPRPMYASTVTKVAPSAKTPEGSSSAVNAAIALLKAISNYDRRIGIISASIHEARHRINERATFNQQLEADINTARHDMRSLDLELEHQRRILNQEELRGMRLQDGQAKLVDQMDLEMMKQRHAAVDMEAAMYTARSDISTACTLNDIGTPSPWMTSQGAMGDLNASPQKVIQNTGNW